MTWISSLAAIERLKAAKIKNYAILATWASSGELPTRAARLRLDLFSEDLLGVELTEHFWSAVRKQTGSQDWEAGSISADLFLGELSSVGSSNEWLNFYATGIEFDAATLDNLINRTSAGLPGPKPRAKKHDWESMLCVLIAVADHDGLDTLNSGREIYSRGGQSRLVDWIADWFNERGDQIPVESEIKLRASKILEKLAALRRGHRV